MGDLEDQGEEEVAVPDAESYGQLYGQQPVADHPIAMETEEPAMRRRSRSGESAERRPARERHTSGSNVIGLPGVAQTVSEIAVLEPRSFDEMLQVVRHLRDRKSVILNLSLMDAAEAQRSVDFVAGATVISDGDQQRIGEGIFLFTPSCVTVTAGNAAHSPEATSHQPFQVPTPIWAAYSDAKVVNGR
ncbi:MAG: hypothetical protein OHK0012_25870 [Synechococcales cyanobacterium]